MANDWGRLDLNDVARQTEWTCPEAVGLMKQSVWVHAYTCLLLPDPFEDGIEVIFWVDS